VLVVRRKSGQSVSIVHRGETLRIKVSASEARNVTLVVDGPETFRVHRTETLDPDGESGVDCFVEGQGSRFRRAVIVRFLGEEMVVRYDDGVVETVPKKTVTIVKKERPEPVSD
jgi:sRNA-binding carbon storage regulator CsrA